MPRAALDPRTSRASTKTPSCYRIELIVLIGDSLRVLRGLGLYAFGMALLSPYKPGSLMLQAPRLLVPRRRAAKPQKRLDNVRRPFSDSRTWEPLLEKVAPDRREFPGRVRFRTAKSRFHLLTGGVIQVQGLQPELKECGWVGG